MQLLHHLQGNGLLPDNQSAYRHCHSTETALLKVTSDALMAADQGKLTLLGLLDLSSAFDCVDHPIFIHRLNASFGYLDKHCAGSNHTWVNGTNASDTTELFRMLPSSSVAFLRVRFLGRCFSSSMQRTFSKSRRSMASEYTDTRTISNSTTTARLIRQTFSSHDSYAASRTFRTGWWETNWS